MYLANHNELLRSLDMPISQQHTDAVIARLQDDVLNTLKDRGISGRRASQDVVGHDGLIRDIKVGRLPSLDKLTLLYEYLGLEFYFGPQRPNNVAPEVEVDGNLFDTVPRYNAQAAGGHGALNLDAEPIDRLAFTRNWLKCQGINAAHCALITAKGDSMEPRIFEGDLIMIDRRKTTIRNHRVYVFNDGDRGTRVKRLEHIPDMGIFLHSDNREDYPPESRIGHAANEIKVLGEVVWSGHKWA